MKRLIRKIEEYIAIRFLKRELSLEYAGKTLIIAHEKLLKELISTNSDSLEIKFTQEVEKQKYEVIANITYSKLTTKIDAI